MKKGPSPYPAPKTLNRGGFDRFVQVILFVQTFFYSPPVSYADIPLHEGDFAACGRRKSVCEAIFHTVFAQTKSLPLGGR